MINSKEALLAYLNDGQRVKYIFFWGHQKPKTGVSKSCFSQWYEAPFAVDDVIYPTAEHYMMAAKARLFGDEEAREKILTAVHPGEAKKFGRGVIGFDEQLWQQHRFEIVVAANLAKFGQNPELKRFLRNTGSRVLVEASPVDRIWGIGLVADHPDAVNPEKWPGLNLLGFALMEVRRQFI